MRQVSRRMGRFASHLLGRPAVLVMTMVIAVAVGLALTSPTAQGAARLAVRLASAVKSLPRRAPSAPEALPNGRVFNGNPAVGALFTMNGSQLGSHSCTASVVVIRVSGTPVFRYSIKLSFTS